MLEEEVPPLLASQPFRKSLRHQSTYWIHGEEAVRLSRYRVSQALDYCRE
jgi:hypothetical protein